MAPKRGRNDKNEASTSAAATAARVTRSAALSTTRATRSATRRGDAVLKPPVDNPEPRKRKKAETKTVIIEHCKQCHSFKKKANQVKNGLKKALAGVNVVLNPEEPRKNCFEIREEAGEIFISLLDMESPFARLEELDVKQVVADIVARLK